MKRTLLLQRAELLAGGSVRIRDYSGRFGLIPWDSVRRPLELHRVNQVLEQLTEFIERADRPWPEKLDQFPPYPTHESRNWQSLALARAGEIVESEARELAFIRSARVAVAIERYRREHDGRLPSTLNDLLPTHLPAAPIDPFSGQPLRLTMTGPAYVVYSVGTNRKDDGGQMETVGPRRPGVFPPDIGMAVTPMELRRP